MGQNQKIENTIEFEMERTTPEDQKECSLKFHEFVKFSLNVHEFVFFL